MSLLGSASSFIDSLQKASFRGVPFFVEAHSADFGRRNVQHEYPLRDTPYSEDLGRKQRAFSVEAYVIGGDFALKRNAIILACEKEGSGQLIHPYLGKKTVVVTECKVSENVREGRYSKISITFLEAGERLFPVASVDSFSKLINSAKDLASKAQAEFDKVYSYAQKPQFFLDSIQSVVDTYAQTLQGIKGNISTTFADFIFSAKQIISTSASIILTPYTLATSIIQTVQKLADIFDTSGSTLSTSSTNSSSATSSSTSTITQVVSTAQKAALVTANKIALKQAYLPFLNFGGVNFGGKNIPGFTESNSQTLPIVPLSVTALGGTTTRTQESINVNAVVNLIKQVAISEASVNLADISYPTYQDAIASRDELLEVIDQQMNVPNLDDDVYQALHEIRKDLVEAVPSIDQDIPSLVAYQNKQTQPSLVITYDLYESLLNDDDLVQRNHVAYPGFIPGGVTLEVIRDA